MESWAWDRDDIDLPSIRIQWASLNNADSGESLKKRLETPPGIAIVEGVPVAADETPPRAAQRIARVCRSLGEPLLQGGGGEPAHIIQVTDRMRQQASDEWFPSNTHEFEFHTDGSYAAGSQAVGYVALLCIRPASSGGETRIMSGATLLRWLKLERPSVVERLFAPFPFASAGAGSRHDPNAITYAPVFSQPSSEPLVRLHRWRIRTGYAATSPMDRHAKQALLALGVAFKQAHLYTQFRLESSDLLLTNNLRLLHARTSFSDSTSVAVRRTLLRLWFPAARAAIA